MRRTHPLVSALTEQGRDFTPTQRRQLLVLIGDLMSAVIPRFRRLAENGQVELSITPYAHPIVPLLFDFQCARDAVPSMHLPQHAFYPGGAERAEWHIQEGLRVFTAAFGVRPAGCWPSEGAVSRRTLELLDSSGFHWAATSSNVLRNSLPPQSAEDALAYNKPYALPQSKLSCFFRDDTLSDLIGFTYATWHGDDAAHNLVNELGQLAQKYADSPNHAVLIALDGENAWEHYPFNGYYFLRALYAGLTTHPQLELMTLSECLTRGLQPTPLQRVTAGSWVHGTLATWMGDPAKNKAWDLLCDAKIEFDRVVRAGTLSHDATVALERQLALCESSDWFWWFGDYNPQDAVSQFDRLFRRQLMNLYSLMGLAVPETLSEPISVGRGTPEHGGTMRRAI